MQHISLDVLHACCCTADGVGPMEPATTQSTLGPHQKPLCLRLYHSNPPYDNAEPYVLCNHAILRNTGKMVSARRISAATQSGVFLRSVEEVVNTCKHRGREQRLRPTARPNHSDPPPHC
jgi:hypothetical protein